MKHSISTSFAVFSILMSGITTSCTPTGSDSTSESVRNEITLQSDTLTPEALWAMGRIGTHVISSEGNRVAYQVSYYSVQENKSRTVLYITDINGGEPTLLTPADKSESTPTWLDNDHLLALSGGELWEVSVDGKSHKQLTHSKGSIEDYLLSPDKQKVILIKSLPYHDIIKEKDADLPLSTGRVVTDLMYRHWDHYVESIAHPFVADMNNLDAEAKDILEGMPYECPMAPFGGTEQLAWSPDSKQIAYTCRTKTGLAYSVSTDADIYLYDIESGKSKNLCKPENYVAPEYDPTKSLKNQKVNAPENLQNNPGYDQNPQFSPDGTHVAWLSMARDGYESDRQRLCVYNLKSGEKSYVTEAFDSNVDAFCWAPDNYTLYYIGVWHATENIYRTNLKGEVSAVTADVADYGSIQLYNEGKQILAERHDYMHPADLYVVTPGADATQTSVTQLTHENKHILDQLASGKVEQRWVKTTDGKDMHYWVVLPPHFDASKKYPTLLFCEGGPQSPVSQFWSYRWNFMIMAAQGYVVIAPNRRGLPGFGSEWCEQISGDWTGQCMNDYLAAIDDAVENLPYVDRDRLAAVGASFGGYSVYWLAGHHEKRFKCFIAHDGAFNLEAMYTETEENWFSNWEYEDAYWNKDRSVNADRTYKNSPHLFVDKWDTPILCIHGEKDYRINATQGMSAFNAARMRGIEAELLIYPDENHWVLKPQNGILWQRTYFNWLNRWIGK